MAVRLLPTRGSQNLVCKEGEIKKKDNKRNYWLSELECASTRTVAGLSQPSELFFAVTLDLDALMSSIQSEESFKKRCL